ncbi:MAG: hypothetical protein KDC07_03870 [Chitinophagaceae bacterium]|nr:hypothetical protein [Chitinophagaceae bacterium]MCB9044802.1 hypothetical protein [Chitinophagales bacterium]
MKKTILALLLFIGCISNARAMGIKLYIGSAETEANQSSRFFLQLVVCNNNTDTIYIRRDDLDNIYPRVTLDASVIGDGGSYYLLNNVTRLIEEPDRMRELVGKHPAQHFEATTTHQKELYEENNKLPQKEVRGEKYYVIAPNKCLTVNSVTQSAIFELVKLEDLTKQEKEVAEVYLTLPVWYQTYTDETRRLDLLIARSSDDLKKCIFVHNKH